MLKNVHLKNLALIKEADIEFGTGLNILTGETGAGKSIILGSINIALGDKASKSFIRNGSDYGLVELQFLSEDPRLLQTLSSLDIPADGNNILVSRKITADSSTARINGTTVTLSSLKAVTSLLVDIHGQHDHQSLLNPAKHLEIVDEFGGPETLQVKTDLHDCYERFKSLRNKYREFSQDPEELAKEKAFLEYEVNEIEEARLTPGEDTSLEEEFKRLSGAEKINEGLSKIRSELFELSDSASGRISDALKELNYLVGLDPQLQGCMDSLMDLDAISRDLDHDLIRYINENAFNEERYHNIRQRLDEINRLKSKYGHSIPDILDYSTKLTERIRQLEHYTEHKAELEQEMGIVKAEVKQLATALSGLRQESAAILEQRIRDNLQDLNFLNVDFRIDFGKTDKIYENGFDKVEFMISTNVGEPVKPLAKVASGGELSRIMLAVKAAIADADHTDTLIFDEIDTGISGRTAQMVAQKMAVLSHDHQLICITHLPQIAAMADTHFGIEKSVAEGSTISGIRKLNRPDSILELARLISGNEITETTILNAEEMKAASAAFKS